MKALQGDLSAPSVGGGFGSRWIKHVRKDMFPSQPRGSADERVTPNCTWLPRDRFVGILCDLWWDELRRKTHQCISGWRRCEGSPGLMPKMLYFQIGFQAWLSSSVPTRPRYPSTTATTTSPAASWTSSPKPSNKLFITISVSLDASSKNEMGVSWCA